MEFKVGDRVMFSSPSGEVVNEPGVVARIYSVSRPFAQVDLDNGQHWLAQLVDLRRENR
ncbi:hypothetical protein [Rhodococcus sp. 2G]|uniref:hypothetical protein n=1 Tax=Rhodococcus sp. 2G TaxID=1570939 RepID=UPI000A75C870|nr:hypothetical protein [Rhodococcus sp. 2G]